MPGIAGVHAARIRAFPEIASHNTDIDLSPELKRQLRSLGYVQ
jgi:hypothetical protein